MDVDSVYSTAALNTRIDRNTKTIIDEYSLSCYILHSPVPQTDEQADSLSHCHIAELYQEPAWLDGLPCHPPDLFRPPKAKESAMRKLSG